MLTRQKGFTLIESMVVIAILGIVSSIALPELGSWVRNSRVQSTADSVVAGFQMAKSEAVRRNVDVRLTLNDDSSWVIGCDIVNTDDADGDGVEDCPAIIKQRDAKDGSKDMSLTIAPGSAQSVVYTGFGRIKTKDEDPISSVEITSSESGSKTLRVNVDGASVRMCLPSASTGDPRAC